MASPSPVIRRSYYQDPCNKLSYVTSTQIGLENRKEPTRSLPPLRTTIYDEKPIEYVMKNPLPVHDRHVTTTNGTYHRAKFHDHMYAQPEYPKAAQNDLVNLVRPDWHRKMKDRNYNPVPLNDLSESKDKYRAKHPMADIYGDYVPSDPVRNVYIPVYRDFVYSFDVDEPSAIRASHPYLTATRFAHRRFSPEELQNQRSMNAMFHAKPDDVAIKLRTRPVEDSFEQKIYKEGRQGNLDHRKEAPSPNDYSHLKVFFRRPLYKGCPPRVFKPVPRLGWSPLMKESYGWPYHSFNKENHTSPLVMCTYQPRQTYAEARDVPFMYTTESQTYGSSKPVSTFLDIHSGQLRDWASNIIGDC